ncbi:MAG: DUF3754 domain-containing protein [Alcanivorax sp.]|uniref:DUF3754 domain-containing protein n=1 Tax=Alcanivorax sp. TaxID=1872427 RepID=UPI003DA725DC
MRTVETRLRYIPYRRRDIVAMCLAEARLTEGQADQFQAMAEQLQRKLHLHFHARQEALKESYLAVNPQARLMKSGLLSESPDDLKLQLGELLEQANYEPVTEADLAAALQEASLFKVRLQVDFSRFKEVLLYSRGQSQRTETLKLLWGLYRKPVTFTHYDNVALYLKVPPEEGEEGERVYLKLFENVPKADIEMLFPETQVRMRTIDKLLIGVPALVGGGVMLTTKLGATLLLVGSLLGFWLGMHAQPVTLDKAALLALLAGLGTLAGFIWKQVKNFRTRKLTFVQALTRNLYFKNVANNASVIFQLVDEAEEEECKETLLAYYFLLAAGEPLSAKTLDEQIERWFSQRWQYRLDFEISDALAKLERLGLARRDNGNGWQACPLEQALAVLA